MPNDEIKVEYDFPWELVLLGGIILAIWLGGLIAVSRLVV